MEQDKLQELECEYALEALNIQKSFSNNMVLKGVTLQVKKGEIIGLVGANGAGKSTLMKIINGVYTSYSGTIKVNGKEATYTDPRGAAQSGIAMVYQELSLVPTMTATQNIYLMHELMKGSLINDVECEKRTKEALASFNLHINPHVKVGKLPIAEQQMIEIVKAYMRNPSVLILDEPTASLTQQEIDKLFVLLRMLKERGVAMILISHRLQEIMELCSRVVVLRDGVVALNESVGEVSLPSIVEAMMGKKVETDEYLASNYTGDRTEPLLEVRNLCWENRLQDIHFTVHRGEILGIAGLVGSGRTEIVKNIYGLLQPKSGEIYIKGKKVSFKSPQQAIDGGLFLVPENRRVAGIIEGHTIRYNVLFPIWGRLRDKFVINDKKGRNITTDLIKKLNVKCEGMEQKIGKLSGGNQQKGIFARAMATESDVLLLDDPTVGIDVEAKREIAKLIRDFSDEGKGILLISSEINELASISDRVLILKKGRITKELDRRRGDTITEKSLMSELLI